MIPAVAIGGAAFAVSHLLVGFHASLQEPHIWIHHRTGKRDLQSPATIIALGWINVLARPAAFWGMRNARDIRPSVMDEPTPFWPLMWGYLCEFVGELKRRGHD